MNDAPPRLDPDIRNRYSPYLFSGEEIARGDLTACLEAARSAPSSFNEQPWRFVLCPRSEAECFRRAMGCLVPSNQEWAAAAGALIFTFAREWHRSPRTPNRHAWHDVGIATGFLTWQASRLGIAVHAMAGLDRTCARVTWSVPDDYAPVAALALGYAVAPESMAETPLAGRDLRRRSRLPLPEIAFAGRWDHGIDTRDPGPVNA